MSLQKTSRLTISGILITLVFLMIAWLHFIPIALEVINIGMSVYEATSADELSEKARSQIEQTMKRQLEHQLTPLRELDSRTRELLGGQGRIELGIDQLSVKLDRWGDQILSGQGELSAQIKKLSQESRDGHTLTQHMLSHMVEADLQAGLRNLKDAIALIKASSDDPVGRQMLGDAKTSFVKHIEYLKREEREGRYASVEHWALIRLSLVGSYLGLGLKEIALQEVEELLALPIQSLGLERLSTDLLEKITAAKITYFDTREARFDRRAKGLEYVQKRLKVWIEAVSEERTRLETLKAELCNKFKLDMALLDEAQREKWVQLTQRSRSAAKASEDELALRAMMILSNEYASLAPCESAKSGCPQMTWVEIPAGTFKMGSNDGSSDEKPIHTVSVKSFLMSETEVTVGQYRKCVEAGRCTEPNSCTWGDPNWSVSPNDKEDHPINCVDWGQARTFAVWAGGDLPTEAQWEYAARGGERYKYAGSNNEDEIAWYHSNSGGSTHSVKTKKKNGYGLYDMSGNVRELTLDEGHSDYDGAPNQAENPWGDVGKCGQVCDNGSSRRVSRGGGWGRSAEYLRVAYRDSYVPGLRSRFLGFRIRRTFP